MPPRSRGGRVGKGLQSYSTPNLPTIHSLETAVNDAVRSKAPATPNSPSEQASVEDNADLESEFTSHFSLSASSEDEVDDDKVTTPMPPLPSRPFYPHSSRSYSYLGPPFYNRPPTPLPPSPSLTSLLRPPFSASPSRPASPDSSDVEASSTPTSTGASLKKSARAAPPSLPRASPKVPTYEYYGFALYLGSSVAFLMYLLWAYLPAPFLTGMGIHYYPNRWWALALPAWLVMCILYIYAALAGYNTGYLTLNIESLENLVDEAAHVAALGADGKIVRGRGMAVNDARMLPTSPRSLNESGKADKQKKRIDWRTPWSESTDGVLDVPIGGVCEILYGSQRDTEAGDEHDGG